MQNNTMANGHIISYDDGKPLRIVLTDSSDMNHTSILYIGTRPNSNAVNISPNNSHRPYGAVLSNLNLAYDQSCVSYVSCRIYTRTKIPKFLKCHLESSCQSNRVCRKNNQLSSCTSFYCHP